MRCLCGLAAVLMSSAILLDNGRVIGGERAAENPVHIKQSWRGGSRRRADDQLWKAAPKHGFIANERDWIQLWRTWEPHRAVPRVDFRRELILVAAVQGPNVISVHPLRVLHGNLHFRWEATERGGRGFRYVIIRIDRSGVHSVNGRHVR